jgi:hypothetical protein
MEVLRVLQSTPLGASVGPISEQSAHPVHGALVTVGFLLNELLVTWLVTGAERSLQPSRPSA